MTKFFASYDGIHKLFFCILFFSSCSKNSINSTLPYARQASNFDIKTEHVEHFDETWTYIIKQKNRLSISLINNFFELNGSKFEISNLKFNGDTLNFNIKLERTNKIFQTLYIHSDSLPEVQINFYKLTLKYY